MKLRDHTAQIQRGVQLLDAKREVGWENQISLPRLHLWSAFSCVLGQLYGDYVTGAWRLCIDADQDAQQYGFVVADYTSPISYVIEFATLTHQWKKEIRRLRKDSDRQSRVAAAAASAAKDYALAA